MNRLLGLHVNSIEGGIPELIAAWRPPVVVTLALDGCWTWVKQASPRTLLVARDYEGESMAPPFGEPIPDLPLRARARVERALAATAAIPADYLQLHNEPAIPDRDAMARLADYDAECCRLLQAEGRKATLANLAVGNPSDLTWWDAYHPALREGRRTGAVLLLHEYNWPAMHTEDEIWYTLRHRQVYERLPAELRLPLILGETGLDEGVRHPGTVQGWLGRVESSEYRRQLEWYDAQLVADPYVLGAAVFMAGQPDGWWSYNVWPQPAQQIAQSASPVYRSPAPPDPGRPWGVDVSWWQGMRVDWRAVRRAGASFGFLRASCGLTPDSTYLRNWREMGNGAPQMARGAYHYLEPEHDPVAQAGLFVAQCRQGPPADGLAWLDVEENALTDAQVRAFVGRAELDLGRVGIYTSRHKAQVIKLGAWAGSRPLWVADWRKVAAPAIPQPWVNAGWDYWQYTNSGQVPGIPGRVDLSWKGTDGRA